MPCCSSDEARDTYRASWCDFLQADPRPGHSSALRRWAQDCIKVAQRSLAVARQLVSRATFGQKIELTHGLGEATMRSELVGAYAAGRVIFRAGT
jgi:hypothetical protein